MTNFKGGNLKYWTIYDGNNISSYELKSVAFNEVYDLFISKGDFLFILGKYNPRSMVGLGVVEIVECVEKFVTGDDDEANTPPYPTYYEYRVSFNCINCLSLTLKLDNYLSPKEIDNIVPVAYEDEYEHNYGGKLRVVPIALVLKLRKAVMACLDAVMNLTDQKTAIDVFISYAMEDVEVAYKIYRELIDYGFNPWFDQESLIPGQNWEVEIRKAIQASKAFVAVLSNASLDKRGYVQKELREGLKILEQTPPSQIYLIPVRVENCMPYDDQLNKLQWVNLFPKFNIGFQKLLGAVQAALSRERRK